ADEPARERRLRVVEDLPVRLVPVDQPRLLGPEPLAVLDRAAVEIPVARHSLQSTTTRRLTFALMKSSNTPGSSRSAMVRAISLRCGGFRSVASRCHTISLLSFELSPELMPSRLAPRRMKGITQVCSSALCARP